MSVRSLELRILDDVQAIDGRRGPLPLTPTLKLLLCALLSDLGKAVDKTRLLGLPERGWQPSTLDGHLVDLRAFLQQNLSGQVSLVSSGGLLRLDLADPEVLDYHRFQQLVEQARQADDDNAVRLLTAALGEFRGMPFGAIKAPFVERIRVRIDEQHRKACLDRAERRFRLRQHAEVLDEVLGHLKSWPDDERLTKVLVRALVAAGRRSDAKKAFDDFDKVYDASADFRQDASQILESSKTVTGSVQTRQPEVVADPQVREEILHSALGKRLGPRELILAWAVVLLTVVVLVALLAREEFFVKSPNNSAPDTNVSPRTSSVVSPTTSSSSPPDNSSNPPAEGPPMVLVYQSGDEPGVGAGRDSGQDHMWLMGIDGKDHKETVYRASYADVPIARIEGAFEVEMNPQTPCPPVARVVWAVSVDGVEKAKGSLNFPASGQKFRVDLGVVPRDVRVRLRVESPVPFDSTTPCYAEQVWMRGVTVTGQTSK